MNYELPHDKLDFDGIMVYARRILEHPGREPGAPLQNGCKFEACVSHTNINFGTISVEDG